MDEQINVVPAFLAILLVTGNIGGMETTGKIRQFEVNRKQSILLKSNYLIFNREYTLTSCSLPDIFEMFPCIKKEMLYRHCFSILL